jgi:hypothetical protein
MCSKENLLNQEISIQFILYCLENCVCYIIPLTFVEEYLYAFKISFIREEHFCYR